MLWRTQTHSWSLTQWWQLSTGVAGRGRAWLGLRSGCSAAHFQLAAPGPGSPSRPVPPSPAADASPCVLPSSSLGQHSEPHTTARPPAPLPYHEGPPARSHVLPARQAAPRSESPIAPLAGFPASFCPSPPPRPFGPYPSISAFPPLGHVPCAYPHPSPLIPYSSSTHCSLLQLCFHPKPLLSPLCPPCATPGLSPPLARCPLALGQPGSCSTPQVLGGPARAPQVSPPGEPPPLGCSRAGLCAHGGVCIQPHSLAVAWVDRGRCSLLRGGVFGRGVGMEAERAAGQPPQPL